MGQASDILYTNETKLRDLTVGQLKDIIIEILNSGAFIKYEPTPERRVYEYKHIYSVPSPYTDPNTHIYCKTDDKTM